MDAESLVRSFRSLQTLAVAVLVACSGCAAEADATGSPAGESTGSAEQAITNADDDTGDAAVVALLQNGKIYCSGVLITPSIVATAAHCITPTPPDQIYFGTKLGTKKGSFIGVSDTKIHPDFDEDTLVNDIALIGLASRSTVTPAPVFKDDFDASFKGLAIRIVGFGAPSAGEESSLRKRTGDTTIASFGDDEFRLLPKPSQTCNGDSGGPAFATIDGEEVVVGIASSGDSHCATYGRHIRIDAFAPFLASYTKSYRIAGSGPQPNAGCAMTAKSTGLPARSAAGSAFLLALAVVFGARRRLRSRKG